MYGDQHVEVVERYSGYERERGEPSLSPRRTRGRNQSPQPRWREEGIRRSSDQSRESYVHARTMRKPKLDFPTFSGGDPYEWLDKAEHYFHIFEVPREEKVFLASYYLDGRASRWWRWLRKLYDKEDKRLGWMV